MRVAATRRTNTLRRAAARAVARAERRTARRRVQALPLRQAAPLRRGFPRAAFAERESLPPPSTGSRGRSRPEDILGRGDLP